MDLKELVKLYAKGFQLTERETEVLFHMTNRVVSPVELGKRLNISLHTVNNHLKKILEKTHSDSKTELLADFLLFLEKQKRDSFSMRPRVLLLDDETDLTRMLQTFLQTKNIECHTFNDPLQAVDAIRKLKIDVVVSDIRMPKLNGLNFLREIRKIHFYEPGVIFISGFPEEYGIENLLDLGAFAFLEKPVNLDKLVRLIWGYVYGSQPKTESDQPISVCLGELSLSAKQLGFGGFFLEKQQVDNQPGLHLEAGRKVEIRFHLPLSEECHKAVCEVIWKRDSGEIQPGYGLKFTDMENTTKRHILELVRTNNILSFIPKGEMVASC